MVMSLVPLRVFSRPVINARQCRFHTSDTTDLRGRLMNEVKSAMKAKDAIRSTTVRSVLSEVYAADKASNDMVPSSTIVNILRKAVVRRNEAATKFTQASRQELADKELLEAKILANFLPPLLSEAEIDRALFQVMRALPVDLKPQKSLGRIFRDFYLKVDKSTVDTSLVKQRVDVLLAEK